MAGGKWRWGEVGLKAAIWRGIPKFIEEGSNFQMCIENRIRAGHGMGELCIRAFSGVQNEHLIPTFLLGEVSILQVICIQEMWKVA